MSYGATSVSPRRNERFLTPAQRAQFALPASVAASLDLQATARNAGVRLPPFIFTKVPNMTNPTNQASGVAAPDDERAKFESHWKLKYGQKPETWNDAVEKYGCNQVPEGLGNHYYLRNAQDCWELWQARASLATQPAAPAEVVAPDNEWRRLALQFDGHRMQALACIKTLLNAPERHRAAAYEFLAAPPLSGEQVLADRIAALASPAQAPAAPSVGEPVALFEKSDYAWNESRIDIWLEQWERSGVSRRTAVLDALKDMRAIYLATPPAAPAATEWKPIETAPRDGRDLLLRSLKGHVANGQWGQPAGWANPQCWVWPFVNIEPAYWMEPLSEPRHD